MGKGKRLRSRRIVARPQTAKIRPMMPIPTWEANEEQPCPCGSRRPYRDCCKPHLSVPSRSTPLWRDAMDLMETGSFDAAERLFRAHFVQYLAWVHKHTVPVLKVEAPFVDNLVDIDVGALTAVVDAVAHCLYRLGRSEDIVPFLNHVESVVPLPAFGSRATYLRAAWLYLGCENPAAALVELLKLGECAASDHRETLELYLDLARNSLAPRQRIAIAERIIDRAENEVYVRLQYTASKAVALLMIGEPQRALDELNEVIAAAPCPEQVDTSEQVEGVWQLAKALSLQAFLQKDPVPLARAEELLRRIPEEGLTSKGKATLFLDLGWVLRDQGRFNEAAESFRRSLAYSPSVTAKVHLGHVYALAGSVEAARSTLSELESVTVEPLLELERLAALAALAIAAVDTGLAREVVARLRGIGEESPFWANQRDQLVIELMDYVNTPGAIAAPTRQKRIVAILTSFNQTVELKPNLFGLGFNVNKMIDNLIRRLGRD